ncbi:hypothetical protein MUK42_35236 [Musa troglodytarum]|uniref:Uncharacterized protein n=1 Tax=Musa troglodytarum TaxID=320322 RepID=A0A9E7FJ21_9LILI|nr:hypothetical protein MUK42_35236 [Musa troglodytarum]
MASHDSRRRRRGLAVLALVASMFWLLASQSICDGRVLNYSIDPSLWLVCLQQGDPGPSSCCYTPNGIKDCSRCSPEVGDPKPHPPATVVSPNLYKQKRTSEEHGVS